MSVEICKDCGCPKRVSYLQKSNHEYHYGNCPRREYILKVARFGSSKKADLKLKIEKEIEIFKDNIKYYENKIIDARDCIKDACLDEVYLCRWDCMNVRLEAA